MNTHFGCDYYPEHWEEERLETDIKLMKEMGISIVRLGEFSWHKMEPEEGKYDFKWLLDAVNKLGKAGIKSIIGTPTAAPPAWLMNKHPEIFPINYDGKKVTFNGRHHDCQSNKTYREYISKLVTKMAETFGENEYVCGWQIDNEFGNGHGDLCFCDSCRDAFRGWLLKKYETVDRLNKAWGTKFWSQEYNSFEEVFLPSYTTAGRNPSTALDHKRFCSDLIVDFQKLQVDIIRKYAKNQFITHNCMGFSEKVNYFDLGKDLDFVTHDQYPGGFYLQMPIDDEAKSAMALDAIRSFKNKNYWIMEQQSGPTGWEILGRTPAPGQLALWAMKSVAHGADNVIFFRWRTCTVGTEQYWHGILPHNGKPQRRYYELKEMISKFAPVMEKIQDMPSNAKVAIVYSYDQYYAMGIQPHHPDLSYVDVLLDYYRAFYDMNIPVDIISDYYNDGNLNTDISKYSLVICPLQYIETKEHAQFYREYIKNGGNMLFTYRNGVKDIDNLCQTEYELPGMLCDVLGIEVKDYDCLRDTSVKVEYEYYLGDGNLWSDIITPTTAQVLGTYQSEYYKGQPAITEHAYGKGKAFYVGTQLDNNLMNKFAISLCGKCNIKAEFNGLEKGIEVVSRYKDNKEYIFFMNHNDHEVHIPNDKLIGLEEEVADKRGILKPYEMAVYLREYE